MSDRELPEPVVRPLITLPPAGTCERNTASCILRALAVYLSIAGLGAIAAFANEPERHWKHFPPSDQEIANAVEERFLEDPAVPGARLDVSMKDGVLSVTGTVPDLLARRRIAEIAGTVRGVRTVVDRTRVEPLEKRSDVELKRIVETAIGSDPALTAQSLEVDVESGAVTLSGTVDSIARRELAIRAVESIGGVRAVDDTTQVDVQMEQAPDAIQAQVEALLAADPWLARRSLSVTVEDRTVYVSGPVPSVYEKERVRRVAWVPGVLAIEDGGVHVTPSILEPTDRILVEPLTDTQITESIRLAFTVDPRIPEPHPAIHVRDEVVILSGIVHDLRAREAAAEIARKTRNVRRVENFLKVRLTEPIPDERVERLVEAALARDLYASRYSLTAEVRGGRLTLAGVVGSHPERMQILRAARCVPGVLAVEDRLVVDTSWTWREDLEIREEIEDEFFWSPFVDSDRVQVAVEGGVATLTGTVSTWNEMQAAIKNAHEGGARRVRNRIRVDDRFEVQTSTHPGVEGLAGGDRADR